MKKTNLLIIILFLAFVFTSACGAVGQVDNATAAENVIALPDPTQALQNANTLNNPDSDELPLAMELSLGSFMLEKTDYPIGPDQASALLPLRKTAPV